MTRTLSLEERRLTATSDLLCFMQENERTKTNKVVYFLYDANGIFLKAEVSPDSIDYDTPDLSVYECNKVKRESHRVF